MADFPESGVRLVAETDDYTSSMDEAIALADEFEAIGDLSVTVDAELDTSGIDTSELPMDEEVEIAVDAQPTKTAEKTFDLVKTIRDLDIMETVWNITGTAVDILGKIESFAVEPILSVGDAVAKVNAQTGNAIPNADKLINDIFYDDLGDSIGQVGDMIIAAQQLKAPVDEAARAALAFTKVFDDQDPINVLNTLNQMVGAGLAKNFTEAGDLLTVAFQNGGNRANDLLTAINNNAVALHDLGLSGPEALSAITSGLDAGFRSANDVVNILTKIKQNVTTAAGNEDSDVSKTLDFLHIANPAETGEAWSADFFASVIDAIKNAPGLTDTEREQLFTNLAGGKQGAKTFSSFLGLDLKDIDQVYSKLEGRTAQAGIAIDDSLRGAIDDFMLAAQEAAVNFLSSEQLDLPGKIEALKTGLQDGLNVLAEGGTLSDALTVALKPIGLDDEFQGLESALGNFMIALLQVVASIQGLTGHGAEQDVTNRNIARLGAQQLPFDLQIANEDDIASTIQTAIARGVSEGDVNEILSTTVGSLLESGATEQAQKIVDAVSAMGVLSDEEQMRKNAGLPIDVKTQVSPETITALQEQIDTAIANTDLVKTSADVVGKQDAVSTSIDKMSDSLGLATTQLDSVTTAAQAAEAASPQIEAMGTFTSAYGTAAGTAAPLVNTVADATKKQGQAATGAAGGISSVAGAMYETSGAAGGAASGLSAVNERLGQLISSAQSLVNAGTGGGSGGTTKKKASGGDFIGTALVGEQGPEFITTDQNLSVLNNKTTEAIIAALQGYIPGGMGGGRAGGNSFSVVNNNIVPNEATADALGYRTAAQLRGMA